MRGGRELLPVIGVTHGLSEAPYPTRRAMVEDMIHHFGSPEVRRTELVWNLERIAQREAKEANA